MEDVSQHIHCLRHHWSTNAAKVSRGGCCTPERLQPNRITLKRQNDSQTLLLRMSIKIFLSLFIFLFFSGCTRQNGSKSTRRMSAVHAHSSLSPFVLGHMGPWGWCQSLESPDEAFVKDAKTNCYKPASLFWILMEGET